MLRGGKLSQNAQPKPSMPPLEWQVWLLRSAPPSTTRDSVWGALSASTRDSVLELLKSVRQLHSLNQKATSEGSTNVFSDATTGPIAVYDRHPAFPAVMQLFVGRVVQMIEHERSLADTMETRAIANKSEFLASAGVRVNRLEASTIELLQQQREIVAAKSMDEIFVNRFKEVFAAIQSIRNEQERVGARIRSFPLRR